MDPQVSASFIPKKPLVGDSRGRGGGPGLLFLITLLIFITSLVTAGGTLAYTQILKNSIASKSSSLTKAQDAYDPGVIQDLIRLDSRLTEAKAVLAKHIAPSAIFTFLSAQTLEKVQFTGFDFTLKDDGSGVLHLDGTADSFSTIALQSDQFGASKVLKDVIFSNIIIDSSTGRVTFSVSAVLDPSLLIYSKNLGQSAAAAAATGTQTQTASSTTN